MPAKEIAIDEIKPLVDKEIGVLPWLDVTQEEINAFADATHDHQWIHVEVEGVEKPAMVAEGLYRFYTAT